jgi:hypothetical protein
MKPEWSADWAWGLPLIALTLAIHGAAITGIAALLTRALTAVESRRPGRTSMALLVAAIVGVLGGALAILHAVDAAVWAAAYLLVGAVSTRADAMLYSVDSITARGASGLQLQPHWKMMGALESVSGLLLFGISTAFLASVMIDVRSLQSRLAQRPKLEVTDSGMDP